MSCSRADIRSTRTRRSRPAAHGSSLARSRDLTPRRWAAIDRALEFQRDEQDRDRSRVPRRARPLGRGATAAPTEDTSNRRWTQDRFRTASAPRTFERPHLAPPPTAPTRAVRLEACSGRSQALGGRARRACSAGFRPKRPRAPARGPPIVLGLAAVAALGSGIRLLLRATLAGTELLTAIDRATSDTPSVAVAPTPAAEAADTPGAAPELSDAGAVEQHRSSRGATPNAVAAHRRAGTGSGAGNGRCAARCAARPARAAGSVRRRPSGRSPNPRCRALPWRRRRPYRSLSP